MLITGSFISMKYLTLNNVKVPALGLGTYRSTGPRSADVIRMAIEEYGYRHIDTAQFYENEREVGEGIRRSGVPREDIFLVTKVWPANHARDRFLPSVESSLRKLGADYVDLLLIHWPNADLPLKTYLTELEKARSLGMTRLVGVSNFNIAQLQETLDLGVPIVTNQVEFHPLIDQEKLRQFMRSNGISLTAYSPLAQGLIPGNQLLQEIGVKYGKSASQVALRWMIQLDEVMTIPKTGNPARLEENMDIFDFELSETDMAQINALRQQNNRLVKDFHGAGWDS